MLMKDQTKEQLLYLWPVVANSESFWAWMNSIWPASANSWEDGAAAHPTRTGDSSERCKQSADTEPTNHCPRKQGYTCTLYQKPQLRDTVRSTLLGWHHPWASQPVQLKKYPWYQGSRHHLWSVAYALNYPFHQLSDKVLPALHSHIKDTTQLFQLDRIFDCFGSISTRNGPLFYKPFHHSGNMTDQKEVKERFCPARNTSCYLLANWGGQNRK